MFSLVAAATLGFSSPLGLEELFDPRTPTVNLSAIRYIACDEHFGSGFLIGDKILVTALHVAKGTNCVDVETRSFLKSYKEDGEHDLAVMTGKNLPTDLPYINISCSPFKIGKTYLAYGTSSFRQPRTLFRMDAIVATKYYTDKSFYLNGEILPSPNMRIFKQYTVPGLSGGPVVDYETGFAHGLVNAGSNIRSFIYEFKDTFLCKG